MSDDGPSGNTISSMETLTITMGILSTIGGTSILVTLLLFPSMMYKETKKKFRSDSTADTLDNEYVNSTKDNEPQIRETNTYVHMIAMLSLSEAVAALAYSFGFPKGK